MHTEERILHQINIPLGKFTIFSTKVNRMSTNAEKINVISYNPNLKLNVRSFLGGEMYDVEIKRNS